MLQPTTIFVIVCVEITLDDKVGHSYSIEPVGVFEDLEEAIDYASKLEDLHR